MNFSGLLDKQKLVFYDIVLLIFKRWHPFGGGAMGCTSLLSVVKILLDRPKLAGRRRS